MTAILVTAALMADLLTANGASEFNPIAKPIMDTQPLLAIAIKLAEIVLVLAVIVISRRKYPHLATLVAVVAVAAGGLGAWSNL